MAGTGLLDSQNVFPATSGPAFPGPWCHLGKMAGTRLLDSQTCSQSPPGLPPQGRGASSLQCSTLPSDSQSSSDRSSSSHLNFLPALQIVHIFQNLPPPGSLLGLPQPTFRLPSASPVTKLTCSLKSLNYLPCTQWFLVLFSEPVSWIVSSPRWGCVFCVGNPTVPNVYSPG